MIELMAVGAVGFYVLLGLETLVLLALIEYERPWWGTFSILMTGVLLHFVCGLNVVGLALTHPGTTALAAAGYFVAGTAWSVVKWFLFALKRKEEYLEAKEAYDPTAEAIYRQQYHEKDNKPAPIPWEKSSARGHFLNGKGGLVPLVRENKERVMLWMVYWPFSAVWTIVNDPIKRLFRHIFNMIQDALQLVANRVFADVK